jgi:hypothetical protein
MVRVQDYSRREFADVMAKSPDGTKREKADDPSSASLALIRFSA